MSVFDFLKFDGYRALSLSSISRNFYEVALNLGCARKFKKKMTNLTTITMKNNDKNEDDGDVKVINWIIIKMRSMVMILAI